MTNPIPSPENKYLAEHIKLLSQSYNRWTGNNLIDPGLDKSSAADAIWNASFIVLSHNTDPDPILTYSNQIGLKLFELSWNELTQMPSRLTAESQERSERARLMEEVTKNGYIANYSGVRISKSGKRFTIPQATVWNLIDNEGNYRGQAARFEYPSSS